MSDNDFGNFADSPIAPATRCFPIVPNDSVQLPLIVKSIYVGQSGDITLRPVSGELDVTFKAVPQGSTLDVRAEIVRSTGTTAAFLVGLA